MMTGPRRLDQYVPQTYLSRKKEEEEEDKKKKKKSKDSHWLKEIEALKEKAYGKPRDEIREIDIIVKVSYGFSNDVDKVLEVLNRVMKDTENILEDPEPELALGSMDNGIVQIHVKPWCDKKKYWDAMSNLLKNIKVNLFKEGIAYKSVRRNS